MASQSQDPRTAEPSRVAFEVERLDTSGEQLVVEGRWYGVRGRRFVRPTLTLALRSNGSERRALADLDHKPWAAEDGQPWTAAFPLAVAPEDAEQIELSVAPDITVALDSDDPAAPTARRQGTAPAARSPRIRGDRSTGRPSAADRAHELDRLKTRLEAIERAHDRERSRRETAESALEEQRAEALRLRSDLGRSQAELDLAATVRRELDTACTELDGLRAEVQHAERQLHDAEDRRQESERRRAAADRALTAERGELERLRHELAGAQRSAQRLAQHRPPAASRSRPEPAAGRSESPPAVNPDPPLAPAPASKPPGGQFDRPAALPREQRLEPMSPRLRALNKLESTAPSWAERPVNPALRPAGNWGVRILAVVLMLAAAAAVVLIIISVS